MRLMSMCIASVPGNLDIRVPAEHGKELSPPRGIANISARYKVSAAYFGAKGFHRRSKTVRFLH
jgi:hypothetical protein